MGKEMRGRRKVRKRGRGERGKGKGGERERKGGVDGMKWRKAKRKEQTKTSNEQILVNPARSLLFTKPTCKCTPNPQIEPKTTQHNTTIECTTQFSNNRSFQRHKVATQTQK